MSLYSVIKMVSKVVCFYHGQHRIGSPNLYHKKLKTKNIKTKILCIKKYLYFFYVLCFFFIIGFWLVGWVLSLIYRKSSKTSRSENIRSFWQNTILKQTYLCKMFLLKQQNTWCMYTLSSNWSPKLYVIVTGSTESVLQISTTKN